MAQAALFALLLLLTPTAGEAPGELPVAADTHPADGPDCELIFALQPHQLNVRIKTNLVFFDLVAEAPRELEDQLTQPEENSHGDALEEFALQHLFLKVDGQPLTDYERTKFVVRPAVPAMLNMFPVHGAKAMIELELALEFPLERSPTRLSMRWDVFPPDSALGRGDNAPPMEVSGQLHDGRVDHPLLFLEQEPEIIWHGEVTDLSELFLSVPEVIEPEPRTFPALSAGLGLTGVCLLIGGLVRSRRGMAKAIPYVGGAALFVFGASATREVGLIHLGTAELAGGLTEDEAVRIFETLHANVYFAFEYEKESDVYDALARSVSGELLADLYRQIYTGLILEEEGGAVARVQALRHLETHIEQIGVFGEEQAPGFLARSRWQVDGKVTHFGHSHERTTEQLAQFTVSQVGGEWRIAGDKILESRVLGAKPIPKADSGPEAAEEF